MHVSVRGADADTGAEAGRGHVSLAGVDGYAGGFGHGDGEVDVAAGVVIRLKQHGGAADGEMRCLGVKDFFGIGVGIGVGHLVSFDIDGGGVTGGDADVAAGILDLDGGVGWNLRSLCGLIVVVLGQAEGVEEVIALIAEHGVERATGMIPPGCADAQECEQDEDADEAAAAADRFFAAQVDGPLRQQAEAGDDEQQRPPVAIPGPEIDGFDVAGEHQQGDDADADEDDGTNHGRNAGTVGVCIARLHGVALSLPGIALGAPGGSLLLAVDAPLGPGIVRRIRWRGWAAGGSGWGYGAHDFLSKGSLYPSV